MQRSFAGIFVGGRSTRMGGRPKGLLEVGGETIVARWRRVFEELSVPCVLVGDYEPYRRIGLPIIGDDPSATGPLAGLIAFLEYLTTETDAPWNGVVVACDMPYVSSSLVRKLVAAPSAVVVAPRVDDLWQPFFARYDAPRALEAARSFASRGERKLQRLLDELGASELALDDDERRELRDWDTPEDVR
jgi:molybdopterin-guanine dinucleotide biosynthesis protein A